MCFYNFLALYLNFIFVIGLGVKPAEKENCGHSRTDILVPLLGLKLKAIFHKPKDQDNEDELRVT